MKYKLRLSCLFSFLIFVLIPQTRATAQTGTLQGVVIDPSGAVVPGAHITLSGGKQTRKTDSGADGRYAFRACDPGSYTVSVAANGFALLTVSNVSVTAGQAKELKLPLTIEVQQQQITVNDENQGVSIDPEKNAGAMVLKDRDLDALSDDSR
jgi:uncharacterized membrane protein